MLTSDSSLKISEFADLFGFPSAAVILAVENQRSKLRKPFYTYRDLAARWGVSVGSVYNILRAHGATVVDLLPGKVRGKKIVSAAIVERIEKAREIEAAL
jgi:hypothetical protein